MDTNNSRATRQPDTDEDPDISVSITDMPRQEQHRCSGVQIQLAITEYKQPSFEQVGERVRANECA